MRDTVVSMNRVITNNSLLQQVVALHRPLRGCVLPETAENLIPQKWHWIGMPHAIHGC